MESWLVVFTLLLRLLSPWARRHGFATIKTQPGSVCLASLSAASVVTAAWSEEKNGDHRTASRTVFTTKPVAVAES